MEISPFKNISNRNSFLNNLDGRVKTILFLTSIVITTFLSHWYLITLLWILSLIGYYTLNIPWKKLFKRLIIPFGIAWIVFLSMLFTNGHTVLTYIPFGKHHLNIYVEGIMLGCLLFLRIVTAVTIACLLSFSTSMIEILETLRICKIPGIIIDLADMMYRYVFIIEETSRRMHMAQMSRMGYVGSWSRRIADTGKIACYVLIKSIDKSISIYNAMLSRGYSEDSVENLNYFNKHIPKFDLLISILALILLLILVVINIVL
ncbi:cobalt ECF transporter T component CbiQ [Clostridium fermenticellae]|uniref:Cobalt ECF transporter T component CbiQ n=1 Tax=Clostridium fermenticellae TaxID=2068654 RepID=A0A386H680_9CLOT|nr:cobalt ECF transporter T component CbiQ [Clostridium fermenticellae]AYD41078.1 cobalt ECF transporter T component CbiQ [Clostridium fermenticellae]